MPYIDKSPAYPYDKQFSWRDAYNYGKSVYQLYADSAYRNAIGRNPGLVSKRTPRMRRYTPTKRRRRGGYRYPQPTRNRKKKKKKRFRRFSGRYRGYRKRGYGRRRCPPCPPKNLSSWKTLDTTVISPDPNECAYIQLAFGHTTHLEIISANCHSFGNTDANVTRIEPVNILLVSGARLIVHHSTMFVEFRNNNPAVMKLDFWKCTAKDNSSVGPLVRWQGGNDDQGLAAVETDPLFTFGTTRMLHHYYTVRKLGRTRTLRAGDETSVTIKKGRYSYNPDVLDHDTSATFQKGKTCFLVIRARGGLAHDSTNAETEIGYSGGVIDLAAMYHYTYNHVIGHVKQSTTGTGPDAFTNGPVQDIYEVDSNIAVT